MQSTLNLFIAGSLAINYKGLRVYDILLSNSSRRAGIARRLSLGI